MGLRALVRGCWNGVAPPERLGVLRVAIGAYALWYVGTRYDLIAELARGDAALYEPVGVFRWLGGPLAPPVADALVLGTIAAGVAFVLGVGYRVAGPLFGGLLLVTLCYRNSWSMIYHVHGGLAFHVLVLGFTRAADGFSVDALRRARRGFVRPTPCADYLWPIRLICALTAATYFLSGLAKLAGPTGWSWASGTVLREQIAVDTIRKEVLEGSGMPLAYALYGNVWLFTLMGVGTYVAELGAPLFLLGRRSRRAWALATWGMHWTIFFVMGIRFRYQMSFVVFLPFFHVEWIAAWVQRVQSVFGDQARARPKSSRSTSAKS